MKTKHIFVAAVDVGEVLPFAVKKMKSLAENMKEQERAHNELVRFIDLLEKSYKQPIYYMGMDIIEAKTYERFMFRKGGFFEIMTEAPLAMNAHFVERKQAEKFQKALVKTLREIMPQTQVTDMFLDSIEVNDEQDESLTYEKWDKMKELKK